MKKENNLISIIVPVYNVEKYIDRCVASIVNQTYSNLEIILVDDGSTDNSGNKCDIWGKQDFRIKVIHKKNGGLSDARNCGLQKATGQFIGFVDSDDWIDAEMYQSLLSVLERDQSDIAVCGVQMVWEDSAETKMLTHNKACVLDNEKAQEELLDESLLLHPVWYKLYKKEVIDGIKFKLNKYHEDTFWSYQVIGKAKLVSIIEDVGYYYWQRKDSIMGAKYSLKRLDGIDAAMERQEYLQIKYPHLQDKGIVNIWFSCLYHGQSAILFLTKEEQKYVFEKLRKTRREYPLRIKCYRGLKLSHKIWLIGSKISLRIICYIRNKIGVGF